MPGGKPAYTAPHQKRTVKQDAITSIADSSGGTASDAIAAITGGGAGCENATKNAVASLAAKVEAMTVAMRDAGLIVP